MHRFIILAVTALTLASCTDDNMQTPDSKPRYWLEECGPAPIQPQDWHTVTFTSSAATAPINQWNEHMQWENDVWNWEICVDRTRF